MLDIPDPTTHEQGTRNIHILLVDDDDSVRTVIGRILNEAGFEVVQAADGHDALKALRARPAAVVLSDLFMPEMDGVELICRIRREFPDVIVIAMSGGGLHGTIDMLPVAKGLGAAEVIHKPIRREELLASIRRLLRP